VLCLASQTIRSNWTNRLQAVEQKDADTSSKSMGKAARLKPLLAQARWGGGCYRVQRARRSRGAEGRRWWYAAAGAAERRK
jgi:hypothetical protein